MPVRTALRADVTAIDELLTTASLPVLDLAVFRPNDFRVVEEGAATIGAIGIERYEPDGLLRSLVVASKARGRGIGGLLVRDIEQHARTEGLRSLYLLTTTADKFFNRLGFEVIARAAMPQSVQQSSEFSTLCPVSAVCMRKTLNGGIS